MGKSHGRVGWWEFRRSRIEARLSFPWFQLMEMSLMNVNQISGLYGDSAKIRLRFHSQATLEMFSRMTGSSLFQCSSLVSVDTVFRQTRRYFS